MNSTKTPNDSAAMGVAFTPALQISVVLLYAITFVASLVGNILVMYIILRKPNARTTVSFLFFNMAVADLLVSLIVMPISTAFYFKTRWIEGPFGDFSCRFFYFVFTLSLAASISTLTVMAFDRFRAIKYPFQSLQSRCGWRRYTAGIWLASACCMSPMLVIPSNKTGYCLFDWTVFHISDRDKARAGLFTFFLVVLYVIPLTLIGTLYSIICHTLWKKTRRNGLNISADEKRTRTQKHKSRVKMLLAIVTLFALCWLPLHVYHMTAWGFNPITTAHVVMFLCFWIAHSNSAINPWMYMYLDTTFKVAFLEIIGRRLPQSKRIPALSTSSRRKETYLVNIETAV